MSAATIAILAPRAPYPLTGGGAIRINRLVHELSNEFEVIFVTLAHTWEEGRWQHSDLERTLGVEVIVIPPEAGRGRSNGASSLLRGYLRPEASRLLQCLVDRRAVRLIQYEYPQGAQNGPIAGAINILDAHNVEHEIVRQLAAAERDPLAKARAETEWRSMRQVECAIWREMDVCLAVSRRNAQQMRTAGARRVIDCPNGCDPVDRLAVEPGRSGPLRALFVGMGDWEPYERGLAWLVNEVLPYVRRRHPIELEVVGRCPRQPVLAADVSYVGEVESVTEHYRRAEVVVVPVFEGSGTRIKVIEAMRYGRPVVSTSLGVEGLPVRSGEHYRQADTPEPFATAIVDLAVGPRGGEEIVQAIVDRAHREVMPLNWPEIVSGLRELYSELLTTAGGVGLQASA